MLVLVTVINIANCYLTTKKQDNLLNIILEYDKKTFSQPGTRFSANFGYALGRGPGGRVHDPLFHCPLRQ